MKIAFELRQEDFLEVLAAHRNSKTFANWARRIFIAMAGLFTTVGLFNLFVQRSTEALMAGIPFFVVVVWVILWAFPRWTARQQFMGRPLIPAVPTGLSYRIQSGPARTIPERIGMKECFDLWF